MRTLLILMYLTLLKAKGIKDNLIKLFPAFAEKNDPRICSGIALNQKYFITTQVCAAQTSTWIHVHVLTAGSPKPKPTELTLNPEFTVGWENNIVVGNMPASSPKLVQLQIQQSPTVSLQKYTLIGFKNVDSDETFKADVTIQDSELCKKARFPINKYFTFNETTEICAEVTVADNNLDTLNFGSVVFDESQNNIIGLLSIMENNDQKQERRLIVLTRLSAYCSYIADGTNFQGS